MGVVVSAVASGLVQNVKADRLESQKKEEKQAQQNNEEEDVERKHQEHRAESPGRIQTPGYPAILLTPASAPPPSSKPLSEARLKEQVDELEEIAENDAIEERQEKEEKEEEIDEVSCKSPSFLDNILSSLRITPIQEETRYDPEPKVEGEVEVFPTVSLPVVSLLPTLTEEISISLAQCPTSRAGWFRRNYTSIETVQKIYGTHPRLGQGRRCQTRLGMSRPRRSVLFEFFFYKFSSVISERFEIAKLNV